MAERTAQLEHRVRELDGRDRLVHLQMSSPTLAEAYETVLQVTQDMLKVHQAGIYRLNEGGGELELKMGLGLSKPDLLEHEDELGDHGPIPLDDTDSIAALTFSDGKPRAGEGREAAVPILYDEKAVGVLWVDSLEEGELDREAELETLWRLGLEAALCIRSAQVAEDLDEGEIDVTELLNLGE